MSRPFSDADLVDALPYLTGFARRLTRDRALADDLVQTAVMRALAHADQFKPGTNFRAWLTTILRNSYFNEMRALSRRPSVDINDVPVPVGGRQEDTIRLRQVCRAADSLPAEQAEALMLVGLDGAEYEEAAREAGVAVGTMKSRVSRARLALLGRGV